MNTEKDEIAQLRKRYGELAKARKRLEERLLYIQEFCQGNLSAIRHKGKLPETVGGPYHYLSRSVKGRREVIYVPDSDLPRVRALTDNWRTLRRGLRHLKNLNAEILQLIRRMAEAKTVKEENHEESGRKRKGRQTRT